MNDKYGTIIYLIILLIIFVAGAFRKKGKSGAKPARQAGKAESVLEKLISSAAGIPDTPVSGKETGNGIKEVEEEEIKHEKEPQVVDATFAREKEKEFLPRGHEGISAFAPSQVQHDKAYSLDDNQKDQHDWSRYEEKRKATSLPEDIIAGFDLRKAVIYSEILTRKYF